MKTPEQMNPIELKGLLRRKGLKPPNKLSKEEGLKMLAEHKKSGKASWRPAQRLDVAHKNSKFRYRWTDKDPANIQRKEAEGWVHASTITGISGEHENPGDSNPLSSVTEYRELTLMALPEDIGQARDEYHQELTQKQTVGLKKRLQKDMDDEAQRQGGYRTSVHGSIVIE